MSENIKLQNTDPLVFIKNFNKLVQYYQTNIQSLQTQNKPYQDIKIATLNKFPLHKYYQTMEGPFQKNVQKVYEETDKTKIKFNKMDQIFLNKHHLFMRKTITKMVQDNQIHIGLIQKSKTFYQLKQIHKKTRSFSHIKLRKIPKVELSHKLQLSQRKQKNKIKSQIQLQISNKDKNNRQNQNDYKLMNMMTFKSPKPLIFGQQSNKKIFYKNNLNLRQKSSKDVAKLIQNRRRLILNQPPKLQMLDSLRSTKVQKANKKWTDKYLDGLQLLKPKKVEAIYDQQNYIKDRISGLNTGLNYGESKEQQSINNFKRQLGNYYIKNEQNYIK